MRFITLTLALPLFMSLAGVAAGVPGVAGSLPGSLPAGVPLERPGSLLDPLERVGDTVGQIRRAANRQLLRQHREFLENDGRDNPAVRGQLLAVAPSSDALAALQRAGFVVLPAGPEATDLGLAIVVLAVPDGMRISRAMRTARKLDPDGSYDVNHVYQRSGISVVPEGVHAAVPAASPRRVGLIDSGPDAAHPALAGVDVNSAGCLDAPVADAHGTAVASLLVSAGSSLFAYDLYCGRADGGAVTDLANALAWLARERVGVVNISLVGPDNAVLARLVAAMQRRGHVLVAAAGNDGPAAAPLFPAAYPGVIGVVGVDARDRPLPESARGKHIDFAAPGTGFDAAEPGGGWVAVRGSSFAAPLVARLAALEVDGPAPGLAEYVTARLAAQAVDAGTRGRDDRYGYGLLGTHLRGGLLPLQGR